MCMLHKTMDRVLQGMQYNRQDAEQDGKRCRRCCTGRKNKMLQRRFRVRLDRTLEVAEDVGSDGERMTLHRGQDRALGARQGAQRCTEC